MHLDDYKTSDVYCRCDSGHVFPPSKVKVFKFNNRESYMLGEMIHTDIANNLIFGGVTKEGHLLACPVCEVIHLSGFEQATSTNEVIHDNLRKLSLDI